MRPYIAMGLFSFLVGCAQAPSLKQGAFYTVDDGEGFFRVCKVLVLDEQGVHVRLYKNKWKECPTIVDVSSLSLGGIDDPDGFGMGHLPVSRKEFATWRPVFVQQGTVAKDELDGYEMWKKSGGGYLGSEEVVNKVTGADAVGQRLSAEWMRWAARVVQFDC